MASSDASDNPRYVQWENLSSKEQMSVQLASFGVEADPRDCYPGLEAIPLPPHPFIERQWWMRALGFSRWKFDESVTLSPFGEPL